MPTVVVRYQVASRMSDIVLPSLELLGVLHGCYRSDKASTTIFTSWWSNCLPKMLNDGAVEYEDGTSATESQILIHYRRGRWAKTSSHSCHGLQSQIWKKGNWY